MGASQPTVSANKQTNNLTTGFKSATSLTNSYALTLTPSLNIAAGRVQGSLSSEPSTSLSTGSTVGASNLNKFKKGEIMKWIIISIVLVGAYFLYKRSK